MKFSTSFAAIFLAALSLGASALPAAVNSDTQARGIGGGGPGAMDWRRGSAVESRDQAR